ncbi:MAG: hypothetical protein HYX75_02355 [Acidobacteria bacterium]|nr:hypothetical protein [Acidobacteriota bacterium]
MSTEEGVGGAEINNIYLEQMGTMTWLNSGGKLVRQLLLIQPDPYGYDINDVIQLADGGFMVVGAEDPDGWGSASDPDLWVVKMSKAGKLMSQISYDCGGDEDGYVLAPGSDGSLVLGGTTRRKGSEEDILLLSRKGETVSWARTFGGKKTEYLSGQVGFSTVGELTFMGSTYSFGARKAMALHADTGGNSCPSFMHTVKVTSRVRATPMVVAGKSTARQCAAAYQGAVTQATVADISLPQSALCQSLDNPEP